MILASRGWRAKESWPGEGSVSGETERIRVVRIIARLVIGGPTSHVVALHAGLNPGKFESFLVSGHGNVGERSVAETVSAHCRNVVAVPELVGDLGFRFRDVRAIIKLYRLIRRVRPQIVHTHTAKAGVLGRIAARLAGTPVVIHTYHGHILRGYYGSFTSKMLTLMERALAWSSTVLIAVSGRVRAELTELGVAGRRRTVVIPLGLELQTFWECGRHRGSLRAELGVGLATRLVAIVGRLVPVKNHEMFLKAAAVVSGTQSDVLFLIMGDGVLRDALEHRCKELDLQGRTIFMGWRADMARMYADIDVIVVSSINEGTPVAIIEAMASGIPVVATDVGGVRDIVGDGETGFVVGSGDVAGMAGRIEALLRDPVSAASMGRRGRVMSRRFAAERLIRDVERVYLAAADRRSLLRGQRIACARRDAPREEYKGSVALDCFSRWAGASRQQSPTAGSGVSHSSDKFVEGAGGKL